MSKHGSNSRQSNAEKEYKDKIRMNNVTPLTPTRLSPITYDIPSLNLDSIDMRWPSGIFKKMIGWTIPAPYEHAYYSELLFSLGWFKVPGGYVFQNDDGINPLPIFTAHLDVVGQVPMDISDKIVISGDLVTCPSGYLGADDRTGVSIILWLVHNVRLQGTYLLFEAEEIGCKGVQDFLDSPVSTKLLLESNICISLDRKGYTDIVTSQMGVKCCTPVFANELQNELFNAGMYYAPAQGLYTDSYYFIDIVPEIVNLSVGYFGSHSHGEIQDISFMDKLATALTQVDWLYLSQIADDSQVSNNNKAIDPYDEMMLGTADTFEEQELFDACDETGMSRDELAWIRRDWDYSKQGAGNSKNNLMQWEKGEIK